MRRLLLPPVFVSPMWRLIPRRSATFRVGTTDEPFLKSKDQDERDHTSEPQCRKGDSSFEWSPRLLVRAATFVLVTISKPLIAMTISGWSIHEVPPNIDEGGRANSFAIDPRDNSHALATSESGGLFKTSNGGLTWDHVDSLPTIWTADVKYLPSNPDVIFVTALNDSHSQNGGGIWRSDDDGSTWRHLWPSSGSPLAATTISIALNARDIFVATSDGVATSHDSGMTFALQQPVFYDVHQISSVVAFGSSQVVAVNVQGIVVRSDDNGESWGPPLQSLQTPSMHSLSRSPLSNDRIYFASAASRTLWVSDNDGKDWRKATDFAPTTPSGNAGGIAFAREVVSDEPSPRGLERSIKVYWGDAYELLCGEAREVAGSQELDYTGPWTVLQSQHLDTREIAVDALGRPRLLATDGGVETTFDNGHTWHFPSTSSDGFHALQIIDVFGQWVSDPKGFDVYFGTQDNSLWASADSGKTWTAHFGGEGFYIDGAHRTTRDAAQITFAACGNCTTMRSGRQFNEPNLWNGPQGSDRILNPPKLIAGSRYIQGLDSANGYTPGLASSVDSGSTWRQLAAIPWMRNGPPAVFEIKTARTVRALAYQAIVIPSAEGAGSRVSLARVSFPLSAAAVATVAYPSMSGFGSIATTTTAQVNLPLYAVDPSRLGHILAVDGRARETWDGGETWQSRNDLDLLVTQSGALSATCCAHENYLPYGGDPQPQISAISFSLDDANTVALGTLQAGTFISHDGGASWDKIPNSESATYVTGFAWRSPEDLFIGTYGRGLWRATWQIYLTPGEIGALCRTPCLWLPRDDQSKTSRYMDRGLVVAGGSILDARIEDGVLRRLTVSPGTTISLVSDDAVPAFDIVESTDSGPNVPARSLLKPKLTGYKLVGLGLDLHGAISGQLLSRSELRLGSPIATHFPKFARNPNRPPNAGRPYVYVARSAMPSRSNYRSSEELQLDGRGFPGEEMIDVLVDGKIQTAVRTDRTGIFHVLLSPPTIPKSYSLAFLSHADQRLLFEIPIHISPTNEPTLPNKAPHRE